MLSDEDKKIWDEFVNKGIVLYNNDKSYHHSDFKLPNKPILKPLQNNSIDLHGMSLNEAYNTLKDFIEENKHKKYVIVISGKSGQIRKEITRWFENFNYVRKIELLKNNGSFKIFMKR